MRQNFDNAAPAPYPKSPLRFLELNKILTIIRPRAPSIRDHPPCYRAPAAPPSLHAALQPPRSVGSTCTPRTIHPAAVAIQTAPPIFRLRL